MVSLLEKFIKMYGRLPTEIDPDYLEMLRMTKYNILEMPTADPGKCANCGAHKNDGRMYIDFDLYVDWFGTVYLCGLCVKDIAGELGIIDKKEEVKEDPLPVLREEFGQAVGTLENVLKEFHDYGISIGIERDPIYLTNNEHGSSDNVVSSTDQSGIDETKQTTSESPASSGRKDVRSLRELLNDT